MVGLFLPITSSLLFGWAVPTNNLFTFFGGTVPTNNLFTALTMLLEKASKNKDKKLGFLDEIRWGRGQGVPGAQPVNAQKIRNNPITGPKLGGGEWVRGQTRFCQKPKFVRFFLKPSLMF